MDDAEIVGRAGDHWIIESGNGRRYFLRERDIQARPPSIGRKGRIGYVQQPSALVLTFVDDDPAPHRVETDCEGP